MDRARLVMISATVLLSGVVGGARQTGNSEAVLIRDNQNQLFVATVLAKPGDQVALLRGVVVVNGHATELRVQPDGDWGPKLVEPKTYFVGGDPARLGTGARAWGLATEERIVGIVQIGASPRR